MRTNKFINKILIGGLLVSAMGISSCEDYLTVLPTDRITEEDFWKSKSDLDNVRAAAYRQLESDAVIERFVYWGELRSDNFTFNDMTNQDVQYVQKGILMPTNGKFDWSPLYTGINYCNLVLDKGEKMTEPGKEVDPSFRLNDWRPIKAEMLSLRALYYFYLVRAYRDVPLILRSVTTDAEARECRDAATPGVNILGKLIADLEGAVAYAADNFGSTSENVGRITKRGVHAILSDMYLWRGCLIQNAIHRGSAGDVVLTAEGDTVSGSGALGELRDECYNKSIEHADQILNYFLAEYEKDLLENPGLNAGEEEIPLDEYPYLTRMPNRNSLNSLDYVYSAVWGAGSADEAVFQLKFDGTSVNNNVPYSYFSGISGNNPVAKIFAAANVLYSSAANSYEPARGFGKTDIRLLQTMNYRANEKTQPQLWKNIISSLSIEDLSDVSRGGTGQLRSTRNQDWAIYRLTDIMLIKAEAIARLKGATYAATYNSGGGIASKDDLLIEGFKLVNKIFERSNPKLEETASYGATEELKSDRLRADYAYPNKDNVKNGNALLTLVYNERQREFVCEGKRWFDIVRQCEATNDPKTVLSDYISLATAVRNRLRELYSVYNPIYSEEIKINGVGYGGNLEQNPVWDRYSEK